MKKFISILVILSFLSLASVAYSQDAPANLTAKTRGKGISLSWSKVSGNDYGYYILRSESPGGGHEVVQFISTPDITSYQDNDVKKGASYGYIVQNAAKNGKRGAKSNEAVAKAGSGDSSKSSDGKTAKTTKKSTSSTAKKSGLEVPTKIKAKHTGNSVILTWKPVAGADGYNVHRSSSAEDEDFKQVADVKEEASYEDSEIEKNSTYFYYVVAYNKKGKSDRSELASVGESDDVISVSSVSKKGVFISFEGFRDGDYAVNEAVCVRLDDRSVWIGHVDNNLPNYPSMVNTGTLPPFPAKIDAGQLGFGINKAYRFMFFYQPDKNGAVFQSASKFQNSWAEWSDLGELPPPTGYKKGEFKFAFGVSPAWFCCLALNTKSMEVYEAVCTSNGRSWSPWKSVGKLDNPRFIKGDYFFGLAYDDRMYYTVLMQPETNGFINNTFNGSAWSGWNEGSQRPRMPEWLTR